MYGQNPFKLRFVFILTIPSFALRILILLASKMKPKSMKKSRGQISLWISVLSIIVVSNICHSAPVTNPISWGSGMNVWKGDPSAADSEYWFYDGWSVGGLKTTTSGTNNTRLVLQPNFSQWTGGTNWVVNGEIGRAHV